MKDDYEKTWKKKPKNYETYGYGKCFFYKILLNEMSEEQQIAQSFVLQENGEPVPPNLPFYYVRINANKIIDGLFVGNQDAAHVNSQYSFKLCIVVLCFELII